MRTGRSLTVYWSLLLGGGLNLIPLNFPLGCGPGSDPPQFPPWVWAWIWSPQFPPWVWAWIWSPSISPLGVGLDLIPLNFPLGCGFGGGSPWQGGSPSRGVSFLEGLLPAGCLFLGGGASLADWSPSQGGSPLGRCLLLGGWQYPSMHWGRPPPWTESQTWVKT